MPPFDDDPEVDALVDRLLDGDRLAEIALGRLGERAFPALARAMDDPRACRQDAGLFAPVNFIWDKISPTATPAAVARMVEFLDHDDPRIRCRLHGTLVRIGDAACAAGLIRALHGRGAEERGSVRGSINGEAPYRNDPAFGLPRGPWGPEFTAPLFDFLRDRMLTGECGTPREVAEVLLNLDRPRAAAVLTGPALFRPGPRFIQLLMALEFAKVEIPTAALLAILPDLRVVSDRNHLPDTVREADGSKPGGLPYEIALQLLARVDPEAARPLVEEIVTSEYPLRRQFAAEALAIVERVEDAAGFVARKAGRGRHYARLGEAQAHLLAAHVAAEAMQHDGLWGFLAAASDSSIDRTAAALDAIDAPRSAAAFREAVALDRGPASTDPDDPRHAATRARAEELEQNFFGRDELDDLPTLLNLYAARHAEQFRPRAPRAGAKPREA